MAVTLTVGHTLNMALTYLDQNGNPMLTPPTPDAAAVWSNTTPATETLVPPATGPTSAATALAAGSDTISVTVTVGGVSFNASIDVSVQAEPQTLTGVRIDSTIT